ncbi:fructose-bisphosphate aldolase class I [Candidatus Saccharibacteria bacterium]|nr:fructose-bisphosphate aldolase class I [Candidatus Saccharibacteria bacterium]
MNILVVGNVLKDVYLNIDTRSEGFETDNRNVKWLDFSFDASEHHFFNRESSYGGAAVTLEVLSKMGISTSISGSDLTVNEDGLVSHSAPRSYRYIMIADGQVSYLVPSEYRITSFDPPAEPYDYLYVDRSAELDNNAAKKISAYLDVSPNTKLVLYARDFNNMHLNSLLPRADLVFSELSGAVETANLDDKKLVYLTDKQFSYENLKEKISLERVDMMTHLSVYSVAAATILGGFVLGESVEDSLKKAKVNVENSRLNAVLDMNELQEIAENTDSAENLDLVAANMVLKPKGILAADESGGSMHKKLEELGIEDTYENRRDYRNILFTTPDLEKYVNGVILFDETARQLADNGQNFVEFLTAKRIIPGIKVDQGLEKFEDSEETYTKGLDGLTERLKEYYIMGLRFAKWRAAFEVRLDETGEIVTPSAFAIEENCRILAEYAKECQLAGLVPIVEPELVYDGDYSIKQSAELTSKILDCLFEKLADFDVKLSACVLKVNMVLAGKKYETQSEAQEVGEATAKVLKEHVPEELAGVAFLSGGQGVEQATENMAEVLKNGPFPWPVTFSFSRALQSPALSAWMGDNENANLAKEAFLARLIANTDVLK